MRNLGSGSCSQVDLIYHLEKRELMAMKCYFINDEEQTKLFDREKKSYSEIIHRFLPKFYGASEKEKYLVMEFINGLTLGHIDKIQLNDEDVVIIIFELIVILEYLHSKKLIYRDLNLNNIMIDIFKNVVLIDCF